MRIKALLVIIALFLTGALSANIAKRHLSKPLLPFLNSGKVSLKVSEIVPDLDSSVSSFSLFDENDQIDDDMDDDTIGSILKIIFSGCVILFSFFFLLKIRSAAIGYNRHARFFSYSSRIIFLQTFRI